MQTSNFKSTARTQDQPQVIANASQSVESSEQSSLQFKVAMDPSIGEATNTTLTAKKKKKKKKKKVENVPAEIDQEL